MRRPFGAEKDSCQWREHLQGPLLTITPYYGRCTGMSNEKPIISFRIRADIKDALRKLANADRRSLSSYIELVLEMHVEDAKRAARKSARKS
jgi:hypothetical protein